MNRDGALQSLWQQEIKTFGTPPAIEEQYDVAIVGAGITGLSLAIKLMEAGKSCIILEAKNLGYGTTGGTTAHLNTFFDATYDQVIKDFNLNTATLLAQAGKNAIASIRENAIRYRIDCELEEKAAYLFATDDDQVKQLEDLYEGTLQAGIDIQYSSETPFPIPYIKQAKIPHQAQFHPIKYIRGLAEAFTLTGGTILEDCRVTEHSSKADHLELTTTKGAINCRHAVYATHTPPGVNLLHFRLAPWRSYVMACTLKNDAYPNALGYDLADPYHYYRTHTYNGKRILIAGGKDHKTAQTDYDPNSSFTTLDEHVRTYFDVEDVLYKWSSQYYEPVDGLPYIGQLPGTSSNVYVATGYNGNGMIFGTVAAEIISSLITGKDDPYEQIFSPARVKPVAAFSKFVEQAASVVGHFIKDKLFLEKLENLADLKEGEGKLVKYEGDSYAMFKDARGKVHALSTTCTHAGCNIAWNPAELTWDCPCHGSRFSLNGEVVTPPATKDLNRIHFV